MNEFSCPTHSFAIFTVPLSRSAPFYSHLSPFSEFFLMHSFETGLFGAHIAYMEYSKPYIGISRKIEQFYELALHFSTVICPQKRERIENIEYS